MSTRFVRSRLALTRTVSGEVIVAAPRSESLDVLAGTAAHVWSLLEQPRSVAEMVGLLTGAYRAPRATIAKDLDALLQELLAHGAIEEVA